MRFDPSGATEEGGFNFDPAGAVEVDGFDPAGAVEVPDAAAAELASPNFSNQPATQSHESLNGAGGDPVGDVLSSAGADRNSGVRHKSTAAEVDAAIPLWAAQDPVGKAEALTSAAVESLPALGGFAAAAIPVSKLPLPPIVRIPASLGAGLIGSYLANKGFNAVEEKAAESSDTVRGVLDEAHAAQARNPKTAMAGSVLPILAGGVGGAYKLGKLASVIRAEQGAAAAVKQVGKIAGSGAVIGGGMELALRPLMDEAINRARETIGLKPEQIDDPTVKSVLFSAALGAALPGLGLKFKNYDTAQVADIVNRVKTASEQGKPITDVLSASEIDAYNHVRGKMAAMYESGQGLIKDPQQFDVSVRQAFFGADRPAGAAALTKAQTKLEQSRSTRQQTIVDALNKGESVTDVASRLKMNETDVVSEFTKATKVPLGTSSAVAADIRGLKPTGVDENIFRSPEQIGEPAPPQPKRQAALSAPSRIVTPRGEVYGSQTELDQRFANATPDERAKLLGLDSQPSDPEIAPTPKALPAPRPVAVTPSGQAVLGATAEAVTKAEPQTAQPGGEPQSSTVRAARETAQAAALQPIELSGGRLAVVGDKKTVTAQYQGLGGLYNAKMGGMIFPASRRGEVKARVTQLLAESSKQVASNENAGQPVVATGARTGRVGAVRGRADQSNLGLAGKSGQGRSDNAGVPSPGVPEAISDAGPAAEPAAGVTSAPSSAVVPDARPELQMQNRERGRAVSVEQMQGIANKPDPDRLGFSKSPNEGAPMVAVSGDAAVIPESDLGKTSVVTMADGSKVPVRYAVIEADAVQASHRADGSQNEAYYSDAKHGDIRALTNGRIAGLQEAYRRGTAAPYRTGVMQQADEHGVPAQAFAGKKNPVLVRVYSDQVNQRADIGRASNASSSLGYSASETAQNDARSLDLEGFRPSENGDVLAAQNADFIRRFVQSVPASERAALMTADRRPTKVLAERIKAAVFARAYRSPELLALSAEDTDAEIKNIVNALSLAAPAVARIEHGTKLDIRPEITQAALFIKDAKARGFSVDEALSQQDAFSRNPMVERLAKFMADNARRPRLIADAIIEISDFIQNEVRSASSGDMFGRTESGLEDLLASANRYIRESYGTDAKLIPQETALATERPANAQRESGVGESVGRHSGQRDSQARASEVREPESAQGQVRQQVASDWTARGQANDGSIESSGRQSGDGAGAAAEQSVRGIEGPVSERTGTRTDRSRITAAGIASRITVAKPTALVGTTVTSAADLAVLAQVYRNPRFETFRIFLMRGNEVVHETAISVRLPDATSFVPDDMEYEGWFDTLRLQMKAADADGYYISHNHPAGDPSPSRMDRKATTQFAEQLKGMRGHVVINSNRYAFISPDGRSEVHDLNLGQDKLLKSSRPHPVVGAKIISPADLAFVGHDLKKPGYVTLVATSGADGRVRAVMEMPDARAANALLVRSGIRRFARVTGASRVFAVGNIPAAEKLISEGYLLDVINDVGVSAANAGENKNWMGQSRSEYRTTIEGEPFKLKPYTEDELRQRQAEIEAAEKAAETAAQERERRQTADQERNDFALTGSNSSTDRAAAQGQRSLFQASRKYVSTPTGGNDFGEIGQEVEAASNGRYPQGAIRLDEGGKDYGHRHLPDARIQQFKDAGYADELEALSDVARNYTDVYEQPNGRLLLVKKNGRKKYTAVELRLSEGRYSVTTWFLEDANPRGKPYEDRGGRTPLVRVARGTSAGTSSPFAPASDINQAGESVTLGASGTDKTTSNGEGSSNVNQPQAPYNSTVEQDRASYSDEMQEPAADGDDSASDGGRLPPSEDATGIKNSETARERMERGLPEAEQAAVKDFGSLWEEAQPKTPRDFQDQLELVRELKYRARPITDRENAILLHRQITVQNEHDQATDVLLKAKAEGDDAGVAENRIRVARLSDELLDLYNVNKAVGTEQGRGLNARRIMANADYSLAAMTNKMRAAMGGRPLKAVETDKIVQMSERIKTLQKKLDEHEASTASKSAHEETVKDAGLPGAHGRPAREARRKDLAGAIAGAIKAGESFGEYAHLVQDFAKNEVANGVRNRDALIDSVHRALQKAGADVSRRVVMDAISGYGQFRALSQEEVDVELRRMKGEMQQIAKLEDMQAGRAPLKTGVERREPGDEERALIKQVNEMKKRMGIEATDPATQLKSALDAIKTRLRNQIRDYEHQMMTGQQTVKERGETSTDAETAVLRAERDGLKAQYDAMFGKSRELSDAQRVRIAESALEKSIAEYERRIREDDLSSGKPASKTPRTPKLEAMRARRDALRAELDALRDAATPTKTPEEIALAALKARLKKRAAELREKLAAGDFGRRVPRATPLDAEALRLKAQVEDVKLSFDRAAMAKRLLARTSVEKSQDTLVKWRRAFLLSSPITLAKLTSAAVERMAFTPAEELVGSALGMLPGVSRVARRAPREGGISVAAEAKAVAGALSKGMRDAGLTLTTGHSELDSLFGKRDVMPRELIDFIGSMHGALKAPVKRAEFERSLQKRIEFNIANGIDVTEPVVQVRLMTAAYKDAQRTIFMQDNAVVGFYKRGLSALEEKNKATGEVPFARKAAASTLKVLLPIIKVPTNIVAETLQYAVGSVTGSARLGKALYDGVENLHQDEADLIMRSLKKGSLGTALMLVGYFLAGSLGGYYQPNDKSRHPRFGTVKIGDFEVPTYLVHNPLLETLQIGATIRHVAESRLRVHDSETRGVPAGVAAAAFGLIDEVPFVREMDEVTGLMNPYERGQFFDRLAKDLVVPMGVQWVARQFDTDADGNVMPRDPKNIWQAIETGVPGLRTEVPVDWKKRQQQLSAR